jgi:pilus assembly protein CpaE
VHPEGLTIAVLYGTGSPRPEIQKVLAKLPQLKVLGEALEAQEIRSVSPGEEPDLVLVDLDGQADLPRWLEQLAHSLPQTAILVCSHNQEANFLIRAMQMGVREFLPLPLTQPDLEAAVERLRFAKRRLKPDANPRGRVIVITGHKGGAGVTTIAANLALALADLQAGPLALVDLGRPFPDVGNFLDQEATYNIFDLIENLASLDHSFIQRIMQPYQGKVAILHGCQDFKEQDGMELEALERIFALLRTLYRWIVVDLSHWLDGLFLQVWKEADVGLMVTELTVPNLRNLKKLWPMLKEWQPLGGQTRVVVNRYQKGNGLQLRDLEQVVQQPAFHTLPSDYPALNGAITQGEPLATAAPRSKLYHSLKELAQKLKEEAPQEEEDAAPVPSPRRRFWIF